MLRTYRSSSGLMARIGRLSRQEPSSGLQKRILNLTSLRTPSVRWFSGSVRDAPDGLRPWQIIGLHIFGYFGKASVRIRQAQAMYRSCLQQADSPSLRRGLGLPEEGFAPKHQLILVHVWILNKRLLVEGKKGKKLQSELFDTLWENSERRIRHAGIQEMSLSKNLAEIQKISFGAMISYDIGLKKVDDDDQELGSAVWRNLFASRDDVPEENVLRVSRWMRSEVDRVMNLPWNRIEEGQIGWTFPDGVVVTEEDRKTLLDKGLIGEWRSAMSVDGKIYWWNVRTRQSQWDRPNGVD